jgi:hypothetical protein
MAFASWYSFRKLMPEVEVCVAVDLDRPIFRWVPILSSRFRGEKDGDFVVPPTVMAVRDFQDDWSVSSSKSDRQTCLVDYSSGCGNFVVDKWINKSQHPFHNATRRFGTSAMTVNEVAVLKMWERCEAVHRATGV